MLRVKVLICLCVSLAQCLCLCLWVSFLDGTMTSPNPCIRYMGDSHSAAFSVKSLLPTWGGEPGAFELSKLSGRGFLESHFPNNTAESQAVFSAVGFCRRSPSCRLLLRAGACYLLLSCLKTGLWHTPRLYKGVIQNEIVVVVQATIIVIITIIIDRTASERLVQNSTARQRRSNHGAGHSISAKCR